LFEKTFGFKNNLFSKFYLLLFLPPFLRIERPESIKIIDS
jgi:hypothetical protein